MAVKMATPERYAPATPPKHDAETLIDRTPWTAGPDDKLGALAAEMLRESYWGVPVADGGGKYLGMVTLRRLADCGLGGSAAALTTVPTLRFMRNGIASARSHFQEIAHRGASEFLDPDVQALDEPVSVPQALMLAFRGQLAAPIVRRQDGRLIGVLRLDDLLRAIVSPS